MSGDPPKVQSKLSDAQLTGASLLSDGEQMEEVARDAEDRESQISSRKSSIKEEVTLTNVMLIKRFLANDFTYEILFLNRGKIWKYLTYIKRNKQKTHQNLCIIMDINFFGQFLNKYENKYSVGSTVQTWITTTIYTNENTETICTNL